MSLAAFGGGFSEGFANSYNQATKERQAREQSDRDTAAAGLLQHLKDHPELEPADQAAVMGHYLKLKTGGDKSKLKDSDIKDILKHHDETAKALGIPKDVVAGADKGASTSAPSSGGAPTLAQAPPSTPAEAAAVPAPAFQAPAQATTEAPPTSNSSPVASGAPSTPAPAPAAPQGPTPATPPPQAPASMQAPAAPAPTPATDLPTIGSGTSEAVAPVSELPTSSQYAVDPNRKINLQTRQANQQQLLTNATAQNAHLQATKEFSDWAQRYREQFGTDPDPHTAKQVQDTISRGYAAKLGVSPKLTTSSQAMSGADLIKETGNNTTPDGVPIDPNGSYTAILDSGQNIIGARSRVETNQGKLVFAPDSPTGFGYLSPTGKLTLNAPVPRSQQERENVTDTYRTDSAGNIVKLQTKSTSGPKPGNPGAPASGTSPKNTTTGAGGTGPQATPATPLPTKGPQIVVPANGGRPMSQEQAMNETGKTQTMKSAIGLVADIHKDDLDTMANMISGGKIEAAIEPSTGALSFVISNAASHSLTDKEASLAGKLQHLNESINAFRGPMGAGGFRGKDARAALMATKGKLGAAKAQTKEVLEQLMKFSVAQLAIRDKAMAKSAGTGKPSLDPDTAKVYLELNNGDVNKAISAAERAGYNVRP